MSSTQAIVSLGHSLGLRVVAEGIEQRDHVELLQELRCDAGQGFYFDRQPDASKLAAGLKVVSFCPAPAPMSCPQQLAA